MSLTLQIREPSNHILMCCTLHTIKISPTCACNNTMYHINNTHALINVNIMICVISITRRYRVTQSIKETHMTILENISLYIWKVIILRHSKDNLSYNQDKSLVTPTELEIITYNPLFSNKNTILPLNLTTLQMCHYQ